MQQKRFRSRTGQRSYRPAPSDRCNEDCRCSGGAVRVEFRIETRSIASIPRRHHVQPGAAQLPAMGHGGAGHGAQRACMGMNVTL